MFGPDLLIAPIFKSNANERKIYLPVGSEWIDVRSTEKYTGGRTITADAPINNIPVFTRADRPVQALLEFENKK